MTAGAKVSRLLALDLGTKTGFAVGTPGCVVTGRWDFSPRRFEGGGMRYLRFRRQLDEIHAVTPIDEVAFEEVRRHLGVDAAHAYGGFMAQLTDRKSVVSGKRGSGRVDLGGRLIIQQK